MAARMRHLAQATTIVMAAFVASRVLGLLREVVIARQFGTSLEYGAYLAAFRIPDLIFYLIAGGALGSAFIPTFGRYLALGDREQAWQLASAVLNLIVLILSACALVAAVIAPWLAALIVPGYDAQTQALTARLMRLMLITPVIFGVSGLFMGILNAHQHFLLPALAPVVYNLSIIAGAIFLAPAIGVHGLAVGVVVGSVLHLAVQVPGLWRRHLRFSATLGLDHPGVSQVGRLMLPRVLGLAVVQLNFVVNTVLASGLGQEALPALNYAWLLAMLPQGVFAMAVATAVFPTFSELAAREQWAELRRTFGGALRVVLYLTLPASTGLFFLRVPLIRLLLERGRFTGASTDAVAWALQFYALGLFAHAAVEIIARAFYALHDTRTPVLIGGGAMAMNVVLSLALMRYLDHGGLALANTLATIAEMAILLFMLRKPMGGLESGRLLPSLGRMTVATGFIAVALSWFLSATRGQSALIVAIGGVTLGGAVYLLISLALMSDEAWAAWRLVRRGTERV